MKILMVSSYLPYPLLNGGHVRLYNLLKILSKNHEITLVCEKRDHQTQNEVREVAKVCSKVITVDRVKQWSFANILKTGFTLSPFLMVGHKNSEMKRKLRDEIKNEKYDLIHVETFYVMQNLPKVNIPVVLAEHNVEYLVYERYVKQSPLILRPLLNLDVLKLKRMERKYWKKASKLIAVSQKEKSIMNADYVIPNGADLDMFKMKDLKKSDANKEKTILFIGDFRWIENRDSASWVIKEIWPKLKSNIKLNLWIVGKKIPTSLKKISNDENIFFDENAPSNTSFIYQKSDILLSPIRVGGGTSFKILEAMSSGVPVVTTKLGVEGIGAIDSIHVLTAESSIGIADKVMELTFNKNLYNKIALNARQFIEDNYSWVGISKKLEGVYKSLV